MLLLRLNEKVTFEKSILLYGSAIILNLSLYSPAASSNLSHYLMSMTHAEGRYTRRQQKLDTVNTLLRNNCPISFFHNCTFRVLKCFFLLGNNEGVLIIMRKLLEEMKIITCINGRYIIRTLPISDNSRVCMYSISRDAFNPGSVDLIGLIRRKCFCIQQHLRLCLLRNRLHAITPQ